MALIFGCVLQLSNSRAILLFVRQFCIPCPIFIGQFIADLKQRGFSVLPRLPYSLTQLQQYVRFPNQQICWYKHQRVWQHLQKNASLMLLKTFLLPLFFEIFGRQPFSGCNWVHFLRYVTHFSKDNVLTFHKPVSPAAAACKIEIHKFLSCASVT